MATQPTVAAEVLNIPIANIIPSKTNPRGKPSEDGIADLASDIANRGVEQAITVRPAKGDKFEIVFGERRYLASKKANQETVPCVVRNMSDDEAFESQIVENLQREDIHPLNEAEAIRHLYRRFFRQTKHHDQTVQLVADRLGHKLTPEFIVRRLKLNELDPAVKDAFRKGDFLLGHAEELAPLRLEEQKIALKWLLEQSKDLQTSTGWKKAAIIPGVPELRLWIRENLFLDLTKAPFDTQDPKLNPAMGACATCKYRTGNQPALFPNVQQGETCTVPQCWNTKRNNTLVHIADTKAKELGVKKVLMVGVGHSSWNHAKIPVDLYLDHGTGARIVKQGTECQYTKPGILSWIGYPSDAPGRKPGDSVLVCTNIEKCEKHKHADSLHERKPKTFEQMADTRIANLRKDTPQRVRAALTAAVIQAALKQEAALSRQHQSKFELIAHQMHQDLYFDRHRDLCKLLAVEPQPDRWKSKDWRGTTRGIFKGNPVALMVSMTVMHKYLVNGYTGGGKDPLPEFLRLYRVNAKAIEKRIKAEVSEKIGTIQASLKKRKAKTRTEAKS